MGVPSTEEDRPEGEKAEEAEDGDWELMRRTARTQTSTERQSTSCRPSQKYCRIDGDEDGGSLFFMVIVTVSVTARELREKNRVGREDGTLLSFRIHGNNTF